MSVKIKVKDVKLFMTLQELHDNICEKTSLIPDIIADEMIRMAKTHSPIFTGNLIIHAHPHKEEDDKEKVIFT